MGTSTIELAERYARRKPEGGFCFLGLEQIAAVWSAYGGADLKARDVRVYFALHELHARRCTAGEGRALTYTLDELQSLVGGDGGPKLRACLRRLERANLVCWSEAQIRFAKRLESTRLREPARALAMLAAMPRMGRVPLPRRMLRHLAAAGRRVELATVLGHAIRSLRYKRGEVWPAGCTPARWIAETFGVAESRVRAERQRLVEGGWLEPADAGWSHRQRFGARFVVNLAWDAVADPAGQQAPPVPRSRPPRADNRPESRRPGNTQNCSSGAIQDTKPAARGPDGALKENPGKPDLQRISAADLRQTPRLLALYRQAVGAGKVRDSECDRLEFIALAEHARAHGSDPPALFAWLLARGARNRITLADEDAARDRMRDWREREVEEPRWSRGGGTAEASGMVFGEREMRLGGLCALPGFPEGRERSSAARQGSSRAGGALEGRAWSRADKSQAVAGGLIASPLYWAQRRLEERRAALGLQR